MSSNTESHLITERSKRLIHDVRTLRDISSGLQVAKLYETAKRTLSSGLRRLAVVAESASAMREAGIRLGKIDVPARELKALVGQIRQEASESVADAVQSDAFSELTTRTDELVIKLESELRSAWTRHVEGHSIGGTGAVDLFEAIGLFAREIEDLKAATAAIKRVDTSNVPTPEEIAAFGRASQAYASAQAAISKTDIPDGVRRFLEDVVDEGAKLSDVDSTILEWIGRHNLSESFRVIVD